jgi:hypothetical protein
MGMQGTSIFSGFIARFRGPVNPAQPVTSNRAASNSRRIFSLRSIGTDRDLARCAVLNYQPSL